MITDQPAILEVSALSVSFRMYDKGFDQKDLKVISNLNITVHPGEVLAIVGSSGSGKSLLASAIMGLLPNNATIKGSMHYKGQPLTPNRQKLLRGTEIAFVPQSVSYLDPLMKIGRQVDGYKKPYPTEKRRAIFRQLSLPDDIEKKYPYQLSGGMIRRVLAATALITEAELIIADEPTPGMSLDQALKALTMFREMADAGKAVILITHDIDLAFKFADRITVFYAGTTVETVSTHDFQTGAAKLHHPYSKALWRAMPQNEFESFPGFQPYAGDLPKGCLFSPRCPHKIPACEAAVPEMRTMQGGEVRCCHAT